MRCRGRGLAYQVSIIKEMCRKAASVLAEENSLVWARKEDGLMTHEDYLTCVGMKVLLEKRNYTHNRVHTRMKYNYQSGTT